MTKLNLKNLTLEEINQHNRDYLNRLEEEILLRRLNRALREAEEFCAEYMAKKASKEVK